MKIEDFYDVIRPMQVYVEVSEDILFAPERIEPDPYRTPQDQDEVTRKATSDVPLLPESKVESEEESWISCLFFWDVRIHTDHTDSNPKDPETYVHRDDVVVVVVDAADNSPSFSSKICESLNVSLGFSENEKKMSYCVIVVIDQMMMMMT